MTSVSTRVADAISAHVTDVFGVMGNGNAHFINALYGDSVGPISYTAVRHETAAVAAADAYYRASGRVAAATVTYGAGFTNMVTSLAEAVRAQIPLLVVAGEAPTSGLRAWDIDQVALAASVGAPTFTVAADDAGRTVLDALEHALNNRTAVILAIPYDLAAADAADETLPTELSLTAPVAADSTATDAAASVLAGAERPFILAGRGAWDAGAADALGALADALGAVTATSALGRGIFPKQQFDLGVTGGFGQDNAMALVKTADVVLVVGASMNQFTMSFGGLIAPGTTLIRIDDVASAAHPAVISLLVGDARLTVEALTSSLAASGATASGWRESLPGLTEGAFRTRDAGEANLPDGLLDPRRVAARLAELLPDDRLVVSDGGHFIGWANTYWPVAAPNRMMMVGTAFQSIGLGFPSAVGATVALPEPLLVVTTGDGGGLMALADLDSVIRTTRRGVIVVWNDAAYGAEVHMYGLMGLDTRPMLIEQADFAALSRALGGRGDVIDTLDDLASFEQWLADGADGVYLLDCRISSSIMAPYQKEIYAFATGQH
ncbi:thiamine pyrophosphate-binding protein [Glaciibacter psychrotolerans]|uniref:Thiamine pyrophosphate-dependent acetolactate synthase large subunit-like protein n=1 Tax=Glaciibacter psychrotolerans TaxID=670054 RepID=A0A7Z0J6M6_9MICO|nr:thiamine pyrophosphate-dependent acetolactate synthase large subunit-like protein [Leifsonia psychrotolerans]